MRTGLYPDIKIGSRWKHHSGREYTVIHVANQFTKNPEYPVSIVYLGSNGKIWVKERCNFIEKMKLIKNEDLQTLYNTIYYLYPMERIR